MTSTFKKTPAQSGCLFCSRKQQNERQYAKNASALCASIFYYRPRLPRLKPPVSFAMPSFALDSALRRASFTAAHTMS